DCKDGSKVKKVMNAPKFKELDFLITLKCQGCGFKWRTVEVAKIAKKNKVVPRKHFTQAAREALGFPSYYH
ncbi:MAG: hypothetical protein SCK28_14545, partial [Bacillota bacterium]|nr:hypothetical protein [Bacillota bacterium]